MRIGKVISTAISKGLNIVKVLRLGGNDVHTAYQVQPFGIDSNIPKGYRAIIADTGKCGDKIVLGIINEKAVAEIGGLRLYSTTSDGKTEATFIELKPDGKISLGGETEFSVKYSGLESEFNKLKKAFNDFASAYVPGGPSNVGLPPTVQQTDADITKAKNEKVKSM